MVDEVLLQGACDGVLHAYDVSDRVAQAARTVDREKLEGCIEATPAVWKA